MSKSGEMPPPYNPAEPYPGQPAPYPGQPGQPAPYPGQPGQPAPYPGQPGQPNSYQGYPGQYGQPMPQHYQTGYTNVVVQQPMPITTGPAPPDHMTAAIFVTLCCFWPTGIIAIIKANDARNAQMRGDMVSANSYARSAKSMINISIIAGICSVIFVAVIFGIYFGLVIKNLNESYTYDD